MKPFAIILLTTLFAGCGRPPAQEPAAMSDAASTDPATTRAAPERFTGTLHGGILAIGAETTGWQLDRDGGVGRIDVNVKNVSDAAQKLDGQRVVIEGSIVTANWVERGKKQLLMAERIEAEPGQR